MNSNVKQSVVFSNFFSKIFFIAIIFLLSLQNTSYSQTTIIDGNSDQDFLTNIYYKYSYSQQIYLQSNMGSACTITGLQFEWDGNESLSLNWKIFLGNTSKTSFANTTDWVSSASMTQVYNGTYSVSAIAGWYTITFDTPFSYDGTNSLVVAVDNNTGSYYSSTSEFKHLSVGSQRVLYARNDATDYNPSSPPTGTQDSYVPSFKIFTGSSCSAPISLTTSSIAQTTCSASWTAPGSAPANGYQWEVRSSGAGGSGATGLAASGTTGAGVVSASVTGLSANTTYTLYVRSDCGGSSYSSWASSSTFKTVPANVTGLTCSTVSSSSISSSWTAVTGAYGYYVLIDQSATYIGDFSGASIVYDPTDTKTFTSLSPSTTYYVHITAFNTDWAWNGYTHTTGCTTSSNNISWVGGTSTNWNTASNWSGNAVPTSSNNVTIPSGTTYSPTINASVTANCSDLTINSGAILTVATSTISGGVLNIFGNILNNGEINHSGSCIIYLKGSSKTIGGNGIYTDFGIIVHNGASYTLINDLSILQLEIYSNETSSFSLGAYSLIVEAVFAQDGVLNLNSGSVEYQGLYADHSFNDSRFNEGTGTFIYNGIYNSQTIQTGTYYNLKVYTKSGNTSTIGSSAEVTVSNDLTIINPSTAGGIATNAYDVTVANNMILGNTGNALTLNLANRIYRASGTGTITMGNVSGHAINVTYSSASNYAISGFGTPTFYGTFTYNSGSAQKVIPATYNNFVSTGSGTKTLFGNIDINGNATLSGGKLAQSTFDITVAGNWSSSGDYFTEGTGTVTFDGSGDATVSATTAMLGGGSSSLFSDSFENGGALSAGWSTTLVTDGGVNPAITCVTSSSYPTGFSASNGSYFVRFNSFTASGTGQMRLHRSSGFSTTNYSNIVVNFDWTKDNGYDTDDDYVNVQYSTNGSTWTSVGSSITRYSASGDSWTSQSVTLPAGAENQATIYIAFLFTSEFGNDCHIDNVSVTGDSGTPFSGEVFNKLQMNKTGGASTTMASNITAQNSLTLTSGLLKTASYTLTLGTSSSNATVTGGSSSSYVVAYDNSGTIGYVKHFVNSNAAYSLPIGDANYYVPMTFTLTSATLSSASITAYTKAVKVPGLSTSLTNYVNRFWEVSPSGITSPTYDISYTYNNADIVGSETNFKPIKKSSGTWYKPASCTFITGTTQGTSSLNAGTNTLTWSSLTSFSSFGAAGDQAVALPIELLSFEAKKYQNNVKVNWKTASEINNDYFTVERSLDGESFSKVSEVDGAGNSTHTISYFLIDTEFSNGINYYRLIQTDYNGTETSSEIVAVDMTKIQGEKVMTVNTAGQEVNESYSGVVFDMYSDGSSVKRIQ